MEQIIAGSIIIWLGIYIIILREKIADRFSDGKGPAERKLAVGIVPLVGSLAIVVGTLFLTGVFKLPQ